MDIRIGQGIDIHPFVEGRPLYLGGVEIPHSKGLEGHSDADALLHAVTDALLGATGRGDIGTYFPNTDPAWRNVRSTVFLERAFREVSADGWRVLNLDCTVLAQVPKILPHIPGMKGVIGAALELPPDRIAIKATTTEHLGFVGREEGITAFAVCLVARQ